jgi:RNA recognition motif-containing protein
MKKIYVGNIAFNATEEDLRNLFSEYGEIESLKIIKDYSGYTKRTLNFG